MQENLILLSVVKKDWKMNGKTGTTFYHNFMNAQGEVITHKSSKKFEVEDVFGSNFDKLPIVKVTYKTFKNDNGEVTLKVDNIESVDSIE